MGAPGSPSAHKQTKETKYGPANENSLLNGAVARSGSPVAGRRGQKLGTAKAKRHEAVCRTRRDASRLPPVGASFFDVRRRARDTHQRRLGRRLRCLTPARVPVGRHRASGGPGNRGIAVELLFGRPLGARAHRRSRHPRRGGRHTRRFGIGGVTTQPWRPGRGVPRRGRLFVHAVVGIGFGGRRRWRPRAARYESRGDAPPSHRAAARGGVA